METTIILNGREISVKDAATIGELLEIHRIDPSHVVVEVNRKIIERDNYNGCKIRDGDRIEILRFVGGG